MARPLVNLVSLDPVTGKPRAGATLSIFLTGTATPATLYEFDDVTPRANPHALDEAGRSAFRTDEGLYDVEVSGLGFTTFLMREIRAGGGVVFSDAEGDPIVVNAGVAADGTSTFGARRDHKHAFDRTSIFDDAEGNPVDVDGGASADGTSAFAARRDHKHFGTGGGGGGGGDASLTNTSAGSVVLGDVVVIDQSANNSFTTTTTPSDTKQVGVAQATIGVSASGNVRFLGKTTVAVQGAVTRGRWLVTDTTAKFAKDSGIADGEEPPAGAFAIALIAAVGPGAGAVDCLVTGRLWPKRWGRIILQVNTTPDNSGSNNNYGIPERRVSTAGQTSNAPKVTDDTWLLSVGDHVMCRGHLPADYGSGGRVIVEWGMKTAVAGNVQPKAAIAVGVQSSTDMRARAYNTVALAGNIAVPGTLGQFKETTLELTMTNALANRPFNIFVGRHAASSEASGDMVVESIIFEYVRA